MTAEKQICCGICICQLTAILSGVSLLYLAVIVIIPSKNELSMDFNMTPIMCTTVLAEDIALKDTKPDTPDACSWTTCGEWCLSKGSGTCMQIHVMARNNGSKVNFRNCVDTLDQNCSALNVSNTRNYKCKNGECKDITGLFHCTKDIENNDCKEITPAFICRDKRINPKSIECKEKCSDPLDGVYSCKNGKCQQLEKVKHYLRECERKCTDLEMRERNVVIFSRERLVASACTSMDSPDNSSSANIESVSSSQEWRDKRQAIFLFCSYVKRVKGNKTYDILTEDCFNATLGSTEDVSHLKDYMQLLQLHQSLGNRSDWIIQPESTLRVMNNTQLRINNDGCVNTLMKECKAFFATHAHDGSDGVTQDRFPCYFTDKSSEYVIGKFNPDLTATLLLVASILPGCLFVLACSCLFFCSKSVGVDDEGHLRVTFLQGGGAGANKEPVQFDELL
ncbi:uncharacterized protein LOC123508234 isoform X1 [Portunus trituberculatus]|uniref:uncharacterized protein LOC123508234 isoform X1 n=1 Tax=Portunus trituberculatus TaxID=210409 RepID=UPI001E1D1D86|nr:uncharacterized protein LOC123508234 isoform X1 [Portunus trituberculatus]